MNEDIDVIRKITKLKKENKKLQGLLEIAEAEMREIAIHSQEESKQLQKMLETVWPKLQNKVIKSPNNSNVSTASVSRCSKVTQTESAKEWNEHITELEKHLRVLEQHAVDVIQTQNSLQSELESLKNTESVLLKDVSSSQQQISELEKDILEYKKQLRLMEEEYQIIFQSIVYESALGSPIPAIFELL